MKLLRDMAKKLFDKVRPWKKKKESRHSFKVPIWKAPKGFTPARGFNSHQLKQLRKRRIKNEMASVSRRLNRGLRS